MTAAADANFLASLTIDQEKRPWGQEMLRVETEGNPFPLALFGVRMSKLPLGRANRYPNPP